jgi:hypothetical protein
LTNLFDTHTKLVVFFDELGLPELSSKHIELAEGLCGKSTGLFVRSALVTDTVALGFNEMAHKRATLLENIDGLKNSLLALGAASNSRTFPWRSVETDWTKNPASMMIGYVGERGEGAERAQQLLPTVAKRAKRVLLRLRRQNATSAAASTPSLLGRCTSSCRT